MRVLLISLLLFGLLACTGEREHPAPPKAEYARAQVPGYSGIRFWGDSEPPGIKAELALIRIAGGEKGRSAEEWTRWWEGVLVRKRLEQRK